MLFLAGKKKTRELMEGIALGRFSSRSRREATVFIILANNRSRPASATVTPMYSNDKATRALGQQKKKEKLVLSYLMMLALLQGISHC